MCPDPKIQRARTLYSSREMRALYVFQALQTRLMPVSEVHVGDETETIDLGQNPNNMVAELEAFVEIFNAADQRRHSDCSIIPSP